MSMFDVQRSKLGARGFASAKSLDALRRDAVAAWTVTCAQDAGGWAEEFRFIAGLGLRAFMSASARSCCQKFDSSLQRFALCRRGMRVEIISTVRAQAGGHLALRSRAADGQSLRGP